MVKVIKRDGSEEELIYEKIVVSILKTGAPIDIARKIAFMTIGKIYMDNKESVTAKELTSLILNYLKAENETWYRNWIAYDRVAKKRETEKELK
ncbi:ATP-cone domain-containing protein [Acidianus hospitalis W1]|uniref:ATP-cone domain-containing protein n=1 Tax=Acidianus hospitalis (strain W1) TaxID=933801 RepID=F4B9I6_ACIHW|nr:ATP cone domain-containing protein [Acidianus hospitalis]AEE95132.1 ATP-cone domain-containing protein [Acidianus hospitalis W1]